MQLQQNIWDDENLINVLKGGGVVVMPTDTIYGIVGIALNKSVVDRIYNLKKRLSEKPCIILIGDISELEKFSIVLSKAQKNKMKEFWPISAMADIGQLKAISIILDCYDKKFSYLHRGTKTLAFRIPVLEDLQNLLLKTGPLIAPSANLEGLLPAQNINEAKNYFGDLVDLYINGREISSKPSKIIKINANGSVIVLRE